MIYLIEIQTYWWVINKFFPGWFLFRIFSNQWVFWSSYYKIINQYYEGNNKGLIKIDDNHSLAIKAITKAKADNLISKENPLLGWPERAHTQWYRMPISKNRITEIHRAFYDYGWAALYQTKKLSQLALTFDYDIFYFFLKLKINYFL